MVMYVERLPKKCAKEIEQHDFAAFVHDNGKIYKKRWEFFFFIKKVVHCSYFGTNGLRQ